MVTEKDINVQYTDDYYSPTSRDMVPGGYYCYYNGQKFWADSLNREQAIIELVEYINDFFKYEDFDKYIFMDR